MFAGLIIEMFTQYPQSILTNLPVRRQVDCHAKDVPCPDIISDYNTFMGGVDLADQVMCYYSVG